MELSQCPLNPEPTASQFAALYRARRTGVTSNPKWYRNPLNNVAARDAFAPNQPPRYPHRLTTTISNESHRAWVFERFPRGRDMTAKEYVNQFDRASGLKSCPIKWITPTAGSFA